MVQQVKCDFCEEMVEKGKYYYIYCLSVETDKQMHFIGLQKLLSGLADYVMEVKTHLSASQILLFRPDILKEYLSKNIMGESVVDFCLWKYVVCDECFIEYIELVPLI